MRRVATVGLAISFALAALPVSADLVSKTYEFKKDTVLTVAEGNIDGLRIDSVRFSLPSTVGGKNMRTGGVPKVEVALSNTAGVSRKVGVAVALFDEGGRLVGVASGGTGLTALKSGRQKTFKLAIDHLNGDAYRARTFQISVESK